MQEEPKRPYVFQPDKPRNNGKPPREQKIFAISGPGTGALYGQRFTKVEAEELLESMILESVGMADAFK